MKRRLSQKNIIYIKYDYLQNKEVNISTNVLIIHFNKNDLKIMLMTFYSSNLRFNFMSLIISGLVNFNKTASGDLNIKLKSIWFAIFL